MGSSARQTLYFLLHTLIGNICSTNAYFVYLLSCTKHLLRKGRELLMILAEKTSDGSQLSTNSKSLQKLAQTILPMSGKKFLNTTNIKQTPTSHSYSLTEKGHASCFHTPFPLTILEGSC